MNEDLDEEMLKNLELLLNIEVIEGLEDESDWALLSAENPEELSDEK